ncbi:unnamed protein product [Porites evermanni]|uniref:F5/8 type C domain-containing protein n=1 Tax=Porites evermanni TaxID=104178 RepID=A0ABN8SZW4_9CNID|nr:unnamed protein product [Porites evermanni]
MSLPAGKRELRFILFVVLVATGRTFSACTSVIHNNGNVKFTASSTSLGPGYPVLHGNDVWCAGVVDRQQFLTVDLGFNLLFDKVLVQGMRDSNRSVSLYYLKTSTDNNTFIEVQEQGARKDFLGPSFDGDEVVATNLTIPVKARWVMINPREPLPGNHLCMRIDIRSCQNEPQPVDGQLTEWSFWSNCTVGSNPCFSTRSRHRTCANPAPAFGGKDCRDIKRMEQVCASVCPVDGMWSDWGAWSPCSETCGNGTRSRKRSCNNPTPDHGGAPCKGDSSDRGSCFKDHCPIDGKWSPWETWSPCTKTCGNGTRNRVRLCNNPAPANGGKTCEGKEESSEVCLVRHCSGCGEMGPLKDSSYTASSAAQQAPFARLNASRPRASPKAWCRDQEDVNGYLQVNLEKPVEVLRVATKGQDKAGAKGWVTKYLISLSTNGSIFTYYMEGGKEKEFSGNVNSFSLRFNHLNTSSQFQYIRFHPISFEQHPCMQVSVFGCVQGEYRTSTIFSLGAIRLRRFALICRSSIAGSSGGCIVGTSAAYENQALNSRIHLFIYQPAMPLTSLSLIIVVHHHNRCHPIRSRNEMLKCKPGYSRNRALEYTSLQGGCQDSHKEGG